MKSLQIRNALGEYFPSYLITNEEDNYNDYHLKVIIMAYVGIIK